MGQIQPDFTNRLSLKHYDTNKQATLKRSSATRIEMHRKHSKKFDIEYTRQYYAMQSAALLTPKQHAKGAAKENALHARKGRQVMVDSGEHYKDVKLRRRHGLALAAFVVTRHMMGFAPTGSCTFKGFTPNSEQYFKVAASMAKFMYKHMREEATGLLLPIFGIFTERDDKGFSSDYAYRIRGLSIHGLLCCDIVRAWHELKIHELDVADQVLDGHNFEVCNFEVNMNIIRFMLKHYYRAREQVPILYF